MLSVDLRGERLRHIAELPVVRLLEEVDPGVGSLMHHLGPGRAGREQPHAKRLE